MMQLNICMGHVEPKGLMHFPHWGAQIMPMFGSFGFGMAAFGVPVFTVFGESLKSMESLNAAA